MSTTHPRSVQRPTWPLVLLALPLTLVPLAVRAGDAPVDPAATAAPAAPATSVVGRVRFAGTAPPRRALAVGHDAHHCGSEVLDESLVVAADGALANAVVVLQGVTGDAGAPAGTGPAASPRLDQRGCAFAPHVQSVGLGASLTVQSSDPVLHNVHAFLGTRTVFNLAMPLPGRPVQRPLDEPGILRIRCDSGHTWMSAYVAVVPHRFHAVSAVDGTFQLPAVPPGTYKLRAWHERLGAVEQAVTVTAEGDAQVSLTFKAPDDAEAPAPAPSATPPLQDALAATRTELQQLEARRRADERGRLAREGQPLFVRYCATCHGRRGDGAGTSVRFTTTPPRDFTRGTYKFRMTPAGSPPSHEDLVRTISVGVRGTHMPAWKGRLTRTQIETLARYLTTLSDVFWSDTPPAPALVIPPEPAYDPQSVARGQAIYGRMQCATCHGAGGGGDGPAARALRDDWGQPIRPANFLAGAIKGGCCGASIYRAVSTGLGGTPMPSFAGAMTEAERWDLAHYVLSLGRKRPALDYLLRDPAGRTTTP
ncbi:MAG: c-type cytochrome [Kofleriaceae bacterium]|nr:c-type cytochrome [Kofleriaceae bacterium]